LDFQLSDEQQQLKKSVREFAEREIAPHVMKWDEACEFPLCVVKELGKLGLLGVVFPQEYAGAGMGYVEYVIAIEELSRRTPHSVPITSSLRAAKSRKRSTSAGLLPVSLSARGD